MERLLIACGRVGSNVSYRASSLASHAQTARNRTIRRTLEIGFRRRRLSILRGALAVLVPSPVVHVAQLLVLDVDAELAPQQAGERGAVAQVHPLAAAGALLLVLRLADDDPVVAPGAGLGRRQPYLLAGRLLVDDVLAAAVEDDVQDTSLASVSSLRRCRWRGENVPSTRPRGRPFRRRAPPDARAAAR